MPVRAEAGLHAHAVHNDREACVPAVRPGALGGRPANRLGAGAGGKGVQIGLYDVDSHNFPNLAMMKISAWHKAQGDNVEFFDINVRLNIMTNFTFQRPLAMNIQNCLIADLTLTK